MCSAKNKVVQTLVLKICKKGKSTIILTSCVIKSVTQARLITHLIKKKSHSTFLSQIVKTNIIA